MSLQVSRRIGRYRDSNIQAGKRQTIVRYGKLVPALPDPGILSGSILEMIIRHHLRALGFRVAENPFIRLRAAGHDMEIIRPRAVFGNLRE